MSGFDPSLRLVRHSSERLLPSRAFVELIRAVLNKGADFRLRAKGISMYPFIKEGDLVTLGRIDSARIRVGDVIALPHPEEGNLIIHRVVRIDCNHFKTKGDFNLMSDGWIEKESILGIVVRVQRTEKEVKQAHVLVQRLIALLSRFSRMPRIRLKLYQTILIRGECY